MKLRIKRIGDYTPEVRAHTAIPKALELVSLRQLGYRWRILSQAASGIITRANADRLVCSHFTPAIQSATLSRLIAAAVAKCCR